MIEERNGGQEDETMQQERIGEAMSAGHEEQALAMPRVCSVCSKRYALVPGASEPGRTGALRCSCGGELVAAALAPGLYEIGTPKKKRRKKVHHAAAGPTPREADQGYNESHGYGPSHGGPTSPGDAPAADEPIEPQKIEPSKTTKEPEPDGPGSPA